MFLVCRARRSGPASSHQVEGHRDAAVGEVVAADSSVGAGVLAAAAGDGVPDPGVGPADARRAVLAADDDRDGAVVEQEVLRSDVALVSRVCGGAAALEAPEDPTAATQGGRVGERVAGRDCFGRTAG